MRENLNADSASPMQGTTLCYIAAIGVLTAACQHVNSVAKAIDMMVNPLLWLVKLFEAVS